MELSVNEQTREEKAAAAKVRIAELATKFLRRTAGDVADMQGGLARLEQGQLVALSEIHQLAHRMVGTGATLGFDSISEHAQEVETLIDRAVPGVMPDEDTRRRISGALETLAAEVRQLQGT
jgi:HPt (histidine-containing phosphotransfer) domain-containing protein